MEINIVVIVLFPLLFMIHEFEEMIMYPSWTKHHEAMLTRRVPVLKDKMTFLQSPAFMLAVLEEFAIVSACTITTIYTQSIIYWYFALLAFTIHLLPHIMQAAILRRYVPAIITSVICLPYCAYAIISVWDSCSVVEHITIAISATLFCVLNLLVMHKVCAWLWSKIEDLINK